MNTDAFRRDARVEFEPLLLSSQELLREVRRARAPSIELPAYFAIIAMTTFGFALVSGAYAIMFSGVLVGLVAAWLFREFRSMYARFAREPESSRRCQIREDGVVVERDGGRVFCEWAIVTLRETPRALLLDFGNEPALAISRETPDAARLHAWLVARVQRTARPARERVLLLLALLQALVMAAILEILPSYVPLP
jgi:hypothetical protein